MKEGGYMTLAAMYIMNRVHGCDPMARVKDVSYAYYYDYQVYTWFIGGNRYHFQDNLQIV